MKEFIFLFLTTVQAQVQYTAVQTVNDDLRSGPNNPSSQQLISYRDNSTPLGYTTSLGQPVYDPLNTMTAGQYGPIVLEDTNFISEFQHFDRERIPERVVHAKGAGAKGYFTLTNDLSQYTRARLFTEVGKQTPITVRFSQVAGSAGSADTTRDGRGFAVKFYTEEGNFDIVGLNTPIFWIRDPLRFPTLIHALKPNPVTHLFDYNSYWDFISLLPETTLMVLFTYSDLGIPANYRQMDGYGVDTLTLTTASGEVVYCKFVFQPNQGLAALDPNLATRIAGEDPDYFIRDLYNNIARGNFPSWNVSVQIMTQEMASNATFNPFDVTKLWPLSLYPLQPVGFFVLNQNPSNYFKEMEQVAFCPSTLIPGIEPSPDKIFQGRMFSYTDTQQYRLGVNHDILPINTPYRTTVANRQRDGRSRSDSNQGGEPNYSPNSFNGPQGQRNYRPTMYSVSGNVAAYNTTGDDNFSHPQYYYNTQIGADERVRLAQNIAASLINAEQFLQIRALRNFYQVSEDFGNMLAQALNLSASQ